jgi:hypothetical protein
MDELKSELDVLKKDVSELKELFTVTFEQQVLVLKNIEKILLNKESVKQSLAFSRLEKGFNLEKEFIQTCLYKNNIIGDIGLFKQYYLRNDIVIPIRKTGKALEYYDKKWIVNDNELSIEDTILENIINTYLELMQSEENDYNEWSDFKKESVIYKRNLSYILKLQSNKRYRKSILNEILILI